MLTDVLKKALYRVHNLTEEQVNTFMEKFYIKDIPRNDHLLKPGKVCNFISIVLKGSLRIYRVDNEDEHTLHFFTENDWAGDFESFVVQKPSANYIQALENTEVAIIGLAEVHDLIHQHPNFLAFFRVMDKWTISTNLYISNMNQSPDDRYRQLLETHPDWINRFPQMYLASYLGMTPETFSRVKSRIRIS